MQIKTADGERNVASQGVGGAALGLAIPGTLAFLNQLGNGGLGLFGNNGVAAATAIGQQDYMMHLQAENGQLKAEKYSDNNDKEVYQQTLADNRNLRNELYAFIKPLAEEAANNRVEIATLKADLKCCCEKQELREKIIEGKINEVALIANNGITALNTTVNCLQNTVNAITKTVIPNDAVCPGWGNVNVTPATTTTTPAA